MSWVVRADGGALLEAFHRSGVVAVRGGDGTGQVTDDLTGADRDAISELVRRAGLSGQFTRMLNEFVNRMEVGDRVLVPGPTRGVPSRERVVLVGWIAGDYYRARGGPLPGMPHLRNVRWDGLAPRQEIERSTGLRNPSTVHEVAE